MTQIQLNCRHFNGFKPCGLNSTCSSDCPKKTEVLSSVLVIHLGALGAVLRSTSLLRAIHRRYPGAMVTWVTQAPAHHLLAGLKDIDRVLTLSSEDLLRLSAMEFDVALVIDKSAVATGVLKQTRAKRVLGFVTMPASGAVVPANPEAEPLWHLGLSDELKFFRNKKSEQQLVFEALALGEYRRDEYQIQLSESEQSLVWERRQKWRQGRLPILGINTGCSPTLPNKKLSIEGHRRLIASVRAHPELLRVPIVLLGGPEDKERNEAIGHGLRVIQSPVLQGLRDGLVSVAACDLVFSGDSLGMHMAIGLKKWVVAWFGPSCAPEIDLYGRGAKILADVSCSPCWKKSCEQTRMCYDQVDMEQVTRSLVEGMRSMRIAERPRSQDPGLSL